MGTPVPPTHLVVWRSTTVDSGGLCVMMAGLQQTLVWPAVSLGFLLLVPPGPQAVLEGEAFVLYVQGTRLPWATGCSLRDSDQLWVMLHNQRLCYITKDYSDQEE